ncbi:hypothetical protein TNIN_165221 [Trichonephila inaurata madagascariensis]|uniref:Uncharacterized protein n=1 Tax=Trichonephila inaurata madagascariensis TaxID=2747483 RepID=A0A8X6MFL9_9ARAC|nr:hypothetical protein TNIN_165221 [Trichonephila inaurata madagascariensis]
MLFLQRIYCKPTCLTTYRGIIHFGFGYQTQEYSPVRSNGIFGVAKKVFARACELFEEKYFGTFLVDDSCGIKYIKEFFYYLKKRRTHPLCLQDSDYCASSSDSS